MLFWPIVLSYRQDCISISGWKSMRILYFISAKWHKSTLKTFINVHLQYRWRKAHSKDITIAKIKYSPSPYQCLRRPALRCSSWRTPGPPPASTAPSNSSSHWQTPYLMRCSLVYYAKSFIPNTISLSKISSINGRICHLKISSTK